MVPILIRLYRNSVLATVVSLLGTLLLAAGIGTFFEKYYLPGIVCVAIAIGFYILGSVISDKKQDKDLAALNNHELDERFRSKPSFCLSFYRKYPSEQIGNYLISLNPDVTDKLTKLMSKGKKKNKT